jgi:hypothetical protein
MIDGFLIIKILSVILITSGYILIKSFARKGFPTLLVISTFIVVSIFPVWFLLLASSFSREENFIALRNWSSTHTTVVGDTTEVVQEKLTNVELKQIIERNVFKHHHGIKYKQYFETNDYLLVIIEHSRCGLTMLYYKIGEDGRELYPNSISCNVLYPSPE